MKMNNTNWTTTELKLKRYKIKHTYNATENSLEIGGIKLTYYQLTYVGIPFLLTAILAIMTFSNIFSAGAVWKIFLIGFACLLAGFYGIFKVDRMAKSNKGKKTIKKDEYHGELCLISENSTKVLIGITDEHSKFIVEDLSYIKSFILKTLS